jgi:hypothetical protein
MARATLPLIFRSSRLVLLGNSERREAASIMTAVITTLGL